MAKLYAVKNGRKTGVFQTWIECEAQVKGFPGAEFKSFKTKEEAIEYMEKNNVLQSEFDVELTDSTLIEETEVVPNYYAYVDGSYDNNKKVYGSGIILSVVGNKILHSFAGNKEELINLRNVAGEVEAAKWAIYYAVRKELPELTIYHDYEGIAKWANKEWKANLDYTKDYVKFIQKARKLITINFIKVAAHTGIELNEEVDMLAKRAIIEFNKKEI